MGTLSSSHYFTFIDPFLAEEFQHLRSLSLNDVRRIYDAIKLKAIGNYAPYLLVNDILKRFAIPNSLQLTQAFSISIGKSSNISVNVLYITSGLCFYCSVGWRYKVECNL